MKNIMRKENDKSNNLRAFPKAKESISKFKRSNEWPIKMDEN